MRCETLEAPARVDALLKHLEGELPPVIEAIRRHDPVFVATVARGSSDHAASYGAFLFGAVNGMATASIPPSLTSRYGVQLALGRAFVLAVSQSGASPDLLKTVEMANRAGAFTLGLVNADDTPLDHVVDAALSQGAGPELSVAATKSFICSAAAIAALAARLTDDTALLNALRQLPERLENALNTDWRFGVDVLAAVESGTFVVGRGPALGMAHEAALKLKETAAIAAQGWSAAEVRHGPRAALDGRMPVIAFALDDPGGEDARQFSAEMQASGSPCLTIGHRSGTGIHLPLPPPLHPWLDPIVAIAAFYLMAEAVARAKGFDPDRPQGLQKVTRTR